MKEIFRKIKGYPNYKVSNKGYILSISSNKILKGFLNKSGRTYVGLSHNNKRYTIMLAKLVLLTFKKKELHKECVIHSDLDLNNHKSSNLKWGTRGDARRMFNTLKKHKRGVYPWNVKLKDGTIKTKYRVVIKIQNQTKTVGYFLSQEDAEKTYISSYLKEYGYYPY